jgi:DNA modification methylase
MQEEKYTQQELFEFEDVKTIKGYPELRWTGKRPYKSTQYYPAQLKEVYGTPDKNGWLNKIFWGDNLQVMSHLLKDFRGKIDLIYIDPPYDSKADYKMNVKYKGNRVNSDSTVFEDKQYSDIWTNDEYLQFMYERLVLCRELLSEKGSIYVQMDEKRSPYIRIIMDEVFGQNNFQREIVWRIGWLSGYKTTAKNWIRNHDLILYYTRSREYIFNKEYIPYADDYVRRDGNKPTGKGYPIEDTWNCSELDKLDSIQIMSFSGEKTGYPTQKNEALLERIIKASSNPDSIIFDCFMGSGTTQAVASKLNRRFIGADINLGAIQTTSKRLSNIINDNNVFNSDVTGFEIYNVNNYEFFRNPIEARELLIEALGIQPISQRKVFDGELDGRNVKIMPVNRIATKADLKELIANLPYIVYDKKKEDNPNSPVDHITLVCMGHEPDLSAAFVQEVSAYKIDVDIVDILTDKKDFEFKREAQADVKVIHGEVVIKSFYPMNLMQKLSLQQEHVDDYKQLVESIMIDWNYDGQTLRPEVIDIPDKNDFVKGRYTIPSAHGRIRVKITDLLSESLEIEVG